MAEVTVRVTAQNATRTGFQQALGDARRFGNDASSSIRGAFSNLGGSLQSSLAGAFAGIGIGAFIQNTFAKFGQINDLAQQFGVSAEAIQRLGQVASESGVSIEQVASALGRLTRSVQAAQDGTGAQADALRELGLSAKELATLSPEQAFLRLADAVAKSSDRNKAYAATLALAGRSAGALFPILQQGSKALEEQFAAIGVVSNETVAKIDQVEDSFSRLGQQITVALGPALAEIGQGLLTLVSAVQLAVQQATSQITSLFLAAGQAFRGNFRGAGDILKAELDASQQRVADFKKTVDDIYSQGSGAAAGRFPSGGFDEEAATTGASSAARQSAFEKDKQTRRQIGEQDRRLADQQRSDLERLKALREDERFTRPTRGGVSENDLQRLKIREQIVALEEKIRQDARRGATVAIDDSGLATVQEIEQALQQIQPKEVDVILRALGTESIEEAQQLLGVLDATARAAIDRAAAAKREESRTRDAKDQAQFDRRGQSPEERRAALEAEQAALLAQAEALKPEDFAGRADVRSEALRIANELGSFEQGGFQGSSGASAFQRIGFASNEFFDTTKKDNTSEQVKQANTLIKKIADILANNTEPLVLPTSK